MRSKSRAWLGWTISGVLVAGLLLAALLASEGIAASMMSESQVVSALTLVESEDGETWSEVPGLLGHGYTMALDPGNEFEYLDVQDLIADPALDDDLYAFFLDPYNVPEGFLAYWADRGVDGNEPHAEPWMDVMWEIINGREPIFYLEVSQGGTQFDLLDGLLYQLDETKAPLQVNGDYPLGTYSFGGEVQAGGEPEYLNVQITFTYPVTVSLVPDAAEIDGCGFVDVYIHLDGVENLYALDIALSFDPGVLEVVDLLPGTDGVNIEPLDRLFSAGYWAENTVDNETDTIWYVATQTHPTEPASGSGNVARIRFRAKSIGVSAITIEDVALSDRDGYLIGLPLTFEDSQISTAFSAEAGLELDIERLNASTVQLSWPVAAEGSGIAEFKLYRSPLPYFELGDGSVDLMPGNDYVPVEDRVTFDDAVLGNVDVNTFYALQVVCDSGYQSPLSGQVGKFEYELFETDRMDYTWIGLVLEVTPPINKASELAAHIVTNSNEALQINTISYWSSGQSFNIYYPAFEFGEFDTYLKYPYRIEIDIDDVDFGSVIWAQVGKVPEITTDTYTLYQTDRLDYSWVLQPLDLTNVTKSEMLANHIIINASSFLTLSTISYYDGSSQSFNFYYPAYNFGDFDTRFGYPYRVEVNISVGDSVTWP